MAKPAIFNTNHMTRLLTAFLLSLGLLLPLLMLFNIDAHIPLAVTISSAILALLTLRSSGKPWTWLIPALFVILLLTQLALPGAGFFGGSLEAIKAIMLYVNGLNAVMPLFGKYVAIFLAVGIAGCSYLFTKNGIGFFPAAILVVLTLFAIWSMGRADLVWYAIPALCALLLLISQNSHEKISVTNVLPLALSVVLISMLILPASRFTIPPLEDAAMRLKQTITDYLFFTEPRSVFTLGSYGYYPMGGGVLGGEAEPSDYPVMIVKTDRKILMRGVIKDEYTGRSFRDTSSARRYLYINPRWARLREKVFMEQMPAESLRKASALLTEKAVVVQMQNNAASTVFIPLYLRVLTPLSNMVPYFNEASELFITRDLEEGDRYTVITPVFEGGDGDLDVLIEAAVKNDPNFAEIKSLYTRLPSHLEQRVYNDVATMTASARTPYEKAMAIMRHLQKYYAYTLKPVTPPENLDFITYFLYVGKEGYCTYFASAMTVLCRMAGLPARYVEGFLAVPASDGLAYVTGKDGHAWTEVYFEGFGWVPFDPTPSQHGPRETPPPPNTDPNTEDDPTPTPTPTPPPENPDQPTPDPNQNPDAPDPTPPPPDNDPPPKNPPPWWFILLVFIAASGLAIYFFIRSRAPIRIATKKTTAKDKIFIYGNAVYALLRLLGHGNKPGETPIRFARRIDMMHVLATPITPLWRLMALSNYSGREPGDEQAEKAKIIYQDLYKPLSTILKIRFRIFATISAKCYTNLDTALAPAHPVPPSNIIP